MGGAVVEIGEQHVFERKLTAGLLEIVIGLGQNVGDRNLVGHGHDLLAQFVVRRVERNGEPIAWIRFGKSPHGLGEADGGNRDAPPADAEAVFARGFIERGSSASRFASGSPIPMTTMWLSRSSGPQALLELQHLLDDFAGREIALQAVEAAGAKDAAHAAADLRADADRAAAGVRPSPCPSLIGRGDW